MRGRLIDSRFKTPVVRRFQAPPALAEEDRRALIPEVVDEKRSAPSLAFQAEAEIARLVGFQRDHVLVGADDGLDAREAGDGFADVGEVDAGEWLGVQELAARPPLDAERGGPVGRERQSGPLGNRHLEYPAEVVLERQHRRFGHLGVVVTQRRVNLPRIVDDKGELGLEALDLRARQVDVSELEYLGNVHSVLVHTAALRVLDLDGEVLPVHGIDR